MLVFVGDGATGRAGAKHSVAMSNGGRGRRRLSPLLRRGLDSLCTGHSL